MSNLLNEIKNLSSEIENLAERVSAVDTELEVKELEQIYKIIEECKGGFKHNKIVKEMISWNNYNNWIDDEVSYFKEKGAFLTKYNHYTSRTAHGLEKINYELWLLQNGELKVYKTIREDSNYQDERNDFNRVLVGDNVLDYFNFEAIVEGIKDALERRLESLEGRTKTQEERLERLNKYLD